MDENLIAIHAIDCRRTTDLVTQHDQRLSNGAIFCLDKKNPLRPEVTRQAAIWWNCEIPEINIIREGWSVRIADVVTCDSTNALKRDERVEAAKSFPDHHAFRFWAFRWATGI